MNKSNTVPVIPSIEGAWSRYCKAIGAHVEAAVAYGWARGEEMRVKARKRTVEANDESTAAARALALAVHEETLDLLDQVLDDSKYNSALAVARYVLSGVEEQIEALGR